MKILTLIFGIAALITCLVLGIWMWLDNHATINRIRSKAMLAVTKVEAEEIRPKVTIYYTVAYQVPPSSIVFIHDTFTTNALRCSSDQAKAWVVAFLKANKSPIPLDKLAITGIWRDE